MAHSRRIEIFLFAFSLAALLLGGIFALARNPHMAAYLWLSGTASILVWLTLIVLIAITKGVVGLDIIAAFSMVGSIYLN